MNVSISAPVEPGDVEDAAFGASDFAPAAITRGRGYFREGRATVTHDAIIGSHNAIESSVRGSYSERYTQIITIRRQASGRILISGQCSCPVSLQCKHIVAAVMQWRADRRTKPPVEGVALSNSLAQWIAAIGDDLQRLDENPGQVRKRLSYILMRGNDGGLRVDLVAHDLDTKGQVKGTPKFYDGNNALGATPAKFLRASDLEIVRRLGYGSGSGGHGRYALTGRNGATLFEEIVETGRAYWHRADGLRLRAGPSRTGTGVWRVDENGVQTFDFAPDGLDHSVAFALGAPHYIDLDSGEAGRLETGLPNRLTGRLLAAPSVSAQEAALVADALERVLPGKRIALPDRMGEVIDERTDPTPRARLVSQPARQWWGDSRFQWPWSGPPPAVGLVELFFDYGGIRVAPDDRRAEANRYEQGRLIRVHRNPAFEAKALTRIMKGMLQPLPSTRRQAGTIPRPPLLWLGEDMAAESHVRLLLDARPMLEAAGWTVEVDADYPVALATQDGDGLDIELRNGEGTGSGIDWFDLSLGVMVDGQRLDLLPIITRFLLTLPAGDEVAMLAELAETASLNNTRLLVTLADDRILPLPVDRIASIALALIKVWSPPELVGGARLHRAQAADFSTIEAGLAEHGTMVGGTQLRALADDLATFRDRPSAEPPAWFSASLRPYQQAGVDWLQMLGRTGFGGVLADDMGLGKTVQLLAHLSIEKQAGRLDLPALVVAPTSVLENWRAETERFAPNLTTLVHRGSGRAKDVLDASGVDVVITSYPLLGRDRDILTGRRWSIAALDEAQNIRNPQAATSAAAFALDARQRIALSGTPVENHLGDIWSLMHFLNPGLLGDARSFRTRYRTPIEKKDDAAARGRLTQRLKPFLLRRTKGEVAAELPEKTEILEKVELNPAQRQLYEATRLAMQGKVREALDKRGLGKSAIIVLDALLKLRQACCDPRLVKTASEKAKAGGSAKLNRLVELIEELKAEGRSALVFSQFTSMLDLIRAELDARGWSYAWLTGDTVDRAAPVKRFQDGEVDLFLVSLKAGGVGLNLTRADTVILYDPWWNPAVEAQAIDRAHRIGQTRNIFIHRLIADATVEEKMLELQARKQGLADALWDGGAGGFAGLTDADVHALFE
ncbi:DEAD/DEAH box helicase [Sphingomonas sanxanigenens]|uniref:DEAD/DEAH box helicase n=1 Tax=Sphingomonas sanxanigenens TaxID=397260 RepID=UPI00046CA2CA|nr:DEAD/DEAH box helicase [Sphingomonas sanxanigenens]